MYFSDSLVGNKKWGRGKKVECGESVVKTEKLKPHPTFPFYVSPPPQTIIAIYSSEEIFTFPHTSVPFRNEWHFTPRAKRVG